jgi:hypothetical protein
MAVTQGMHRNLTFSCRRLVNHWNWARKVVNRQIINITKILTWNILTLGSGLSLCFQSSAMYHGGHTTAVTLHLVYDLYNKLLYKVFRHLTCLIKDRTITSPGYGSSTRLRTRVWQLDGRSVLPHTSGALVPSARVPVNCLLCRTLFTILCVCWKEGGACFTMLTASHAM